MLGGADLTKGEIIRSLRKEKGLTQAELADKLKVSYVVISQLENNKRNPKYETLRRIAAALGVSVDEFYKDGYEDPKILAFDDLYEEAEDLLENSGYSVSEVADDRIRIPIILIRHEGNVLSVFENDFVAVYSDLSKTIDSPSAKEFYTKLMNKPAMPEDYMFGRYGVSAEQWDEIGHLFGKELNRQNKSPAYLATDETGLTEDEVFSFLAGDRYITKSQMRSLADRLGMKLSEIIGKYAIAFEGEENFEILANKKLCQIYQILSSEDRNRLTVFAQNLALSRNQLVNDFVF